MSVTFLFSGKWFHKFYKLTCLAFLMIMRASAVKPAKAIITWLSRTQIFCTVRSSWSLATAFFSTPSTTTSLPRTPTAVEPFLTASWAYSTCENVGMNYWNIFIEYSAALSLQITWNKWPSGEKIVIARS